MKTTRLRWQLAYLWRTALPTAAFVLTGMGFVWLVGRMGQFSPVNIVGDTRGAAALRGRATVTAIIPIPGTRFCPDPCTLTTLDMGDRGRDVLLFRAGPRRRARRSRILGRAERARVCVPHRPDQFVKRPVRHFPFKVSAGC